MSITLNGTTGLAGTNGSAGTPAVQGEDTNTGIFFPAADTVAVATAGAERLRVDSSGNLGLGVTPSAWSGSFKALQVGPRASVYSDSASGTLVGNNIYNDGSNRYIATAAASVFLQEAGAHKFFNAPSGTAGNAITFTQAMTLDDIGRLLVGTTTSTGERVQISGAVGAGTAKIQVGANGNNGITFANATGGTSGSITVNASTVAYNTSSDYRLKENVAPMQNALDTVAQLNPVTYTWKADGSAGQGFIAHELQAVVPDCVTGEKDAVDAEGKPKYQGVDTSFLVATLVAALQEQQAIITAFETRLAALEAK